MGSVVPLVVLSSSLVLWYLLSFHWVNLHLLSSCLALYLYPLHLMLFWKVYEKGEHWWSWVRLEHVLFMPMKPLGNLIIISFLWISPLSSGGFQEDDLINYFYNSKKNLHNSFDSVWSFAKHRLWRSAIWILRVGCMIRLFMHGVNSLSVEWTGPPDWHSYYSLWFRFIVGLIHAFYSFLWS